MKTANGYIRVSSEDQADSGLDLEPQRQRIGPYCELKGLHLAEVLEDPGVSGGKALSILPAGARLLALARKQAVGHGRQGRPAVSRGGRRRPLDNAFPMPDNPPMTPQDFIHK
jgi:hypothetical protein